MPAIWNALANAVIRLLGALTRAAKPPRLEAASALNVSPMLARQVASVRDFMERQVGAGSSANAELVLPVAAGLLISWSFERIYSFIYGSQLNTLLLLNSIPAVPAQLPTIQKFYADAVTAAPDAYPTKTFDEWLGYLTGFGLVRRDGDGIAITEEGSAFTNYVVSQQLPLAKPF